LLLIDLEDAVILPFNLSKVPVEKGLKKKKEN
jgi:hypothetical protein